MMKKKKNKKILLIQPTPYDQYGNLVKKRRLYFVGLAMPLLAALTPKGYEVEICYETIEDVPFDTDADLVGISSMGHAVMRTIDIANKFRELGKTVVLGGYMVSLMPEEAKKYADVVMIDEFQFIQSQTMFDIVNHFKKSDKTLYIFGLDKIANGDEWPAYSIIKDLVDKKIKLNFYDEI